MQENIENLLSILESHATEKRYASTIDLMWFLCRLMAKSVVKTEASSKAVSRLCLVATRVLPIIDYQVQEEDIRIEFRNVLNELVRAIFVLGQKKQVAYHITNDLKILLDLNLESKPVRSIIWDDLTGLDWESSNESAFKRFKERRLKLILSLNQEVLMFAPIEAGKDETGYLKTLQCYGRMILPWFSSLIYQPSSTGIKQDTMALLAPLEPLLNGVLPFLKDDRALELIHIYLYWMRDRSALPAHQKILETFVQSAMSSPSRSLVALSYCARLVMTDAFHNNKKEALATLCKYVLQLENGLAKEISVSTLPPVLFNDHRASLQKMREIWQTPITNLIDSVSTKSLSKKTLPQKIVNQSLHSEFMTHKQKIFSKDSVHLIQTLLAENVTILGEPPGKFALLLLGSSSRNDRLPYSDIECALIYEATPEQAISMRSYLYTLLSLLEFSVIRLGETQDLIAGSYAGFHLDSGEHILSTQNKLIGTVDQLYDWHIESTIFQSPGDLIVSSSASDEIKGKFLYSMLNPCLVNQQWGGQMLFLAYQSKVQSLLNRPIDSWTRQVFKQTYFENKRIEDRQHKLLDKKQLFEELSLLANPDLEKPQAPEITHRYLPLRQMIALYCWLDILRKAEETLSDAQQTKNPATQSKINIKDVYHKPLVYLALNLQLFLGTSEKHPIHMFEAAFIAGILILEVKILLQEMFSCIIQIRSNLHCQKKAQEEETLVNALSPTDQVTLEIIEKVLLKPMKTIMEDLLMKEIKNEISLPSWIITLNEVFNQVWVHYCKSRFDWQTRLLTHPLLMCLTNYPGLDGTKPIDHWLAQKNAQQQRALSALNDKVLQAASSQKQPTTLVFPALNENPAFTVYVKVYPEISSLELECSLLFISPNLSWIELIHLTMEGKFYSVLLSQGIEAVLFDEISRSSPKEVFETLLAVLEPKKTDHLPSGSLLVEKLTFKDETLTGKKLLRLTQNTLVSYLYLEKTQVTLEDLKTLLSFSGCTGAEICLGENPYLGLEAWQYLLHSPLCQHFSLKLTHGEILCLKGKTTTDSNILPSHYLHTLSEQKKYVINQNDPYLQTIETLLIQEGYPLKSFEACLDYQADRKASFFIISNLTYLVRLLEERQVAPEQYLNYYSKLNKSWKQIFYEFVTRGVFYPKRCLRIQNMLGEYPDSDGHRKFTQIREQALHQNLMKLIKASAHNALSEENVTIEGLSTGKVSIDKRLIEQLIVERWLIINSTAPNKTYDFNFALKEERKVIEVVGTSSVLHGNHLVIPIVHEESQLHLKVQPDFPGMEIAYSLLSDRVTGRGSPLVELWKWQSGSLIYPVLLSETIIGQNLTPKLLKAYPLELISYQRLVLMAMLTNPGDGNPGNFIAQKVKTADGYIQLKLFSVDNDRLFAPPFETGKLRTATILYCFNEIQLPLHQDLRKVFLALNAYEVLKAWLGDLEKLNEQYSKIFKKALKQSKPDTSNQYSYLLTMLKQQTIYELFHKIKIIQYWLSNEPQITLEVLLKKVHPSLANHYQSIRIQYNEPIERFEAAVKNEYRREEIQGVKRYTSTMHMEQYLKMQGREITQTKTVASYWQQDFAQAQKELKDLSISREIIELAKLQLLQGNLKGFDDLPEAYGQEEVIASIHFNQAIRDSNGLPDSQAQQAVISQIINNPGLKPLERLILSHCAITDTQLQQLLKRLPNLKTLKLTNCSLIKESFHEILLDSDKLPKQLQTCILEDMTGIEEIRLTSHSMQYLAVKRAQNLKTFYFHGDSLTQLKLSHEQNKKLNYVPQCHQFTIHAKSLQEADFSGNILLTDQHLQAIFLNCQHLKQMNLQGCNKQKIHYRALKEAIPVFAEKVAENEEEEAYLQAVSGTLTAIIENRTEKKLSLCNVKNLSGWLWKCFCSALMENNSVEYIKVKFPYQYHGELNDEDAIWLANTLERNQALTEIRLSYNKIGDKGIVFLSEALKYNQTLAKIFLNGNNIGYQGILALIRMLEKNKTIQIISVSENVLDSVPAENYSQLNLANCSRIHLQIEPSSNFSVLANKCDPRNIPRAYESHGVVDAALYGISFILSPALIPSFAIASLVLDGISFRKGLEKMNNLSSNENYKPEAFTVNPFAFFSEHADREAALSLPEKRKRKFNFSLQKSFGAWEKSKKYASVLKQDKPLQTAAFQFGFKCIAIEKDGNCLFEAIAQQLKVILPQQHQFHYNHIQLRELAVSYLMTHQEFYEDFVEDHSFESFIRKMRLPGTWAEHTALNALAHFLNVTIVIINSDNSPPIVLKKPQPQGIIYLGYEINIHYHLLAHDSNITPQKNIKYFIDCAATLEAPIIQQTETPVTQQKSFFN